MKVEFLTIQIIYSYKFGIIIPISNKSGIIVREQKYLFGSCEVDLSPIEVTTLEIISKSSSIYNQDFLG